MQEHLSQLKKYYELYYPFDEIGRMCAEKKNREIAYYWQAPSRWHSSENLKKKTLSSLPWRLEMGAIYSVPVEERSLLGLDAMVPVQKELIFDIDIDETFDELRCCGCVEKKFCRKCWPLVTAQAHVIDLFLKHLYDFKHVLWVYSGRRGVHCWVLDKKAMQMSERGRRLLTENFTTHYKNDLATFAENPQKYYLSDTILTRSMASFFTQVLRAHFQVFAAENNLFSSPNTRQTVEKICGNVKNSAQLLANPKFAHTALHFCYPRLDAPVTRHVAHLLKLPFCVHPATFSISVPMYSEIIPYAFPGVHFDFDAFAPCAYPKNVPNFLQLVDKDEIENFREHKKIFSAFITRVYGGCENK